MSDDMPTFLNESVQLEDIGSRSNLLAESEVYDAEHYVKLYEPSVFIGKIETISKIQSLLAKNAPEQFNRLKLLVSSMPKTDDLETLNIRKLERNIRLHRPPELTISELLEDSILSIKSESNKLRKKPKTGKMRAETWLTEDEIDCPIDDTFIPDTKDCY